MPLIKLQTTEEVSAALRDEVLSALSVLIADSLGKPEQYVMACVESASIRMSGEDGPAAFLEVRSIGVLGGEVNADVSSRVCTLLQELLAIPPERVYINFTDVVPSDWGWNGTTFG